MNVAALVASAVELQDSLRANHRKYEVLGRLYALECEDGKLQFDRHNGPGVAQAIDEAGNPTGTLLFVSPWTDLPALPAYSEDFCKACLQKCDVCGGKKKAVCIFTGCGGRGTVQTGEDACPDCVKKAGHFDPACRTCGGRGAVAHREPCPACKGSGQAACGACRGTGKRPTGRNNRVFNTRVQRLQQKGSTKQAAIEAMSAHRDTICAECHGTQRAGELQHQELGRLIVGQIGNYLVIPVARLLLRPVADASEGGRFSSGFEAGRYSARTCAGEMVRITPERDRLGQRMMILLPMKVKKGTALLPYFYGGRV